MINDDQADALRKAMAALEIIRIDTAPKTPVTETDEEFKARVILAYKRNHKTGNDAPGGKE